jgi:hypothetical protein
MTRPPVPELDYNTIRVEFNSLMTATGNRLAREWPPNVRAHDGLAPTLRALVVVSAVTYRTIVYICADNPPAPELEYALSATPLARTLLDAVFAVVFLFEDPIGRPDQFYKGGWREKMEENARYHTAYGADPSWAGFSAEHDRVLKKMTEDFDITQSERANPSSVNYWPTPAQMKNRLVDAERKAYLEYMNDWFMREMSQDTHLSFPGLQRRFNPLTIDDPALRRNVLTKLKSDAVGTSLVLMMALMSEIELELRYGLANRLKYVWSVLNPYYLIAKEVYDFRYNGRL